MASINRLLVLVLGAAIAAGAQAQAYPSKPVRIIVATGAGSAADALARVVAQNLGEKWSSSVIVENRPGAGGVVGTQAIVKSPPDGYTLGLLGTNHVVNPALNPNLPYDSVKDLKGVMGLSSSAILIVANPALGAGSVKDLIAMAKSKPGTINYGSPGNGTLPHLVMELFAEQAGLNMTHVPYASLSTMMTDLLAGRVTVASVAGATALPLAKAQRLNLLTVATGKSKFFPDVPTGPEAGLPGLVVRSFLGMVAPAGTPDPVIAKLYADVSEIAKKKDFETQLANNGFEADITPGEQFWKNVATDIPVWIRVVKKAGIKAD